jgi:hypothetical protein
MVLTEGFNGSGDEERSTAARSNRWQSSLGAQCLGVEGGNFEGGTVLRGQRTGLDSFYRARQRGDGMAGRGKSSGRQSGD